MSDKTCNRVMKVLGLLAEQPAGLHALLACEAWPRVALLAHRQRCRNNVSLALEVPPLPPKSVVESFFAFHFGVVFFFSLRGRY